MAGGPLGFSEIALHSSLPEHRPEFGAVYGLRPGAYGTVEDAAWTSGSRAPGRHLTGRPQMVTVQDGLELRARLQSALHRGWASSDPAVLEAVLEAEDEAKPDASMHWLAEQLGLPDAVGDAATERRWSARGQAGRNRTHDAGAGQSTGDELLDVVAELIAVCEDIERALALSSTPGHRVPPTSPFVGKGARRTKRDLGVGSAAEDVGLRGFRARDGFFADEADQEEGESPEAGAFGPEAKASAWQARHRRERARRLAAVPAHRRMSARRAQSATTGPAVDQPVTCVQVGSAVAWDLTEGTGNYPVYVKDSYLNTNPDFDYGAFRRLQDYAEANGGTADLTLFAFTFTQAGTYTFSSSADPTAQTLIVVTAAGEQCAVEGSFVPQTEENLVALGVTEANSPLLGPNWDVLAAIMGGLLVVVVVIITGVWIFRDQAWGADPGRRSGRGKAGLLGESKFASIAGGGKGSRGGKKGASGAGALVDGDDGPDWSMYTDDDDDLADLVERLKAH